MVPRLNVQMSPDPVCNVHNVVVAPAEGVGVDSAGAQVNIGVLAGGLAGGAAVEVPDGQCLDIPLLAVIARLESLQAESAVCWSLCLTVECH